MPAKHLALMPTDKHLALMPTTTTLDALPSQAVFDFLSKQHNKFSYQIYLLGCQPGHYADWFVADLLAKKIHSVGDNGRVCCAAEREN